MLTLNGAPQVELTDFNQFNETSVNRKLREWAAARRCVNCEYWWSSKKSDWCTRFKIDFTKVDEYSHEFSCAAFSPIETKSEE